MSNVPSIQPPQHFLELIRRMYDKRDQVLESTDRLVDYTSKLDDCDYKDNKQILQILTEVEKEINHIISYINELAPHIKNPAIIPHISKQAKLLSVHIQQVRNNEGALKGVIGMLIRVSICQEANKTQLRPTPKSIKQAFGITVSPRDIKFLFEHHQDNY